MSERTEYRTIPLEDCVGSIEYFLQFKHTESGVMRPWWNFGPEIPWTKSTWLFIPKNDHGTYSGRYLHQGDCPDSLPIHGRCGRWVGGWITSEYELEVWANCHPNIEPYFEERRIKHAKYIKHKEEERRDCKIRYLGKGDER